MIVELGGTAERLIRRRSSHQSDYRIIQDTCKPQEKRLPKKEKGPPPGTRTVCVPSVSCAGQIVAVAVWEGDDRALW